MPSRAAERRPWTREELLLALNLYWQIPFGKQHARNPEIIELAKAIGRTPASVAMKLNNLTSIDPEERGRVRGLRGASKTDREIFEWWEQNREQAVVESEQLWVDRVEHRRPGAVLIASDRVPAEDERRAWVTEATSARKVRLGQRFFRRAVLANFDGRCALTGIDHRDLIVASHIVGWAEDSTQRLRIGNGLALNRLHDGAFDRKLVTFDEDLRLVVGRTAREVFSKEELGRGFLKYEGERLRDTVRHAIDPVLMRRHREQFATVNAS
ncbi:MAG: HNH endonuclease [Deltaproteobacteria bacterium]|nr:HNH endonuclease [Deltaproteobacteria bacterium]